MVGVVYVCVFNCSVVSDSFVTPWTVAHQAPLSMRFPRQEHCGGLPFPSPGDLPDPGVKPTSSELAGGFFTTELLGSHDSLGADWKIPWTEEPGKL